MVNEPLKANTETVSPWVLKRDEAGRLETTQFLARVDFRHISSHISQRKPGYYLILLRNELRHRSLREKPALGD